MWKPAQSDHMTLRRRSRNTTDLPTDTAVDHSSRIGRKNRTVHMRSLEMPHGNHSRLTISCCR